MHSLFTDANIKRHAHDRRMVASGFSLSALLEMEDFVSECVKVFETRMAEFSDAGQPIDMAHWLQCYAFDVIGEITVIFRYRSKLHSTIPLIASSLRSVSGL
jgi:cytochrome P450